MPLIYFASQSYREKAMLRQALGTCLASADLWVLSIGTIATLTVTSMLGAELDQIAAFREKGKRVIDAPGFVSRDREERRGQACSVASFLTTAEHKGLLPRLQRTLWSPDARLNASLSRVGNTTEPYIRDRADYMAFVGDKSRGQARRRGDRWEAGGSRGIVHRPLHGRRGLGSATQARDPLAFSEFCLRDLAGRGYTKWST